jgi:ABC-type lipoprotein export system ATPase subunit
MEQPITSKYALSVDNLSFKFDRKNPYFFKDISLNFTPHTIHFIQGKNGSGKSTLFRILRGYVHQDEHINATFYLHGKKYVIDDPEMIDKKLTSQIKMVHQNFDLMIADQFTFRQNLRLAKLPEHPHFAPLPEHQPLPALVKRFGIDYDHQPAYLLSGGQRQILTILMALQKPTTILLLDEPTAALDQKNASIVMAFLKELLASTSLTILIICHDKELVDQYATDHYFEINVDEKTNIRSISPIKL